MGTSNCILLDKTDIFEGLIYQRRKLVYKVLFFAFFVLARDRILGSSIHSQIGKFDVAVGFGFAECARKKNHMVLGNMGMIEKIKNEPSLQPTHAKLKCSTSKRTCNGTGQKLIRERYVVSFPWIYCSAFASQRP